MGQRLEGKMVAEKHKWRMGPELASLLFLEVALVGAGEGIDCSSPSVARLQGSPR